MSDVRIDIRNLSQEEIKALVTELGEKPYRAKQLWEWLWKKKARAWADMSDLPKTFREKLAERTLFRPLVLAEEQRSEDGTVKCAFKIEHPVQKGQFCLALGRQKHMRIFTSRRLARQFDLPEPLSLGRPSRIAGQNPVGYYIQIAFDPLNDAAGFPAVVHHIKV